MSAQDNNFCLVVKAMGAHQPKRSHQYYYQVLWAKKINYSVFLRTFSFTLVANCTSIIIRTLPRAVFKIFQVTKSLASICLNYLEPNLVPKAKEFFVRGILPELIGKWYSRPVTSAKDVSATVKGGDSKEFCYCKGGEHGQMVGCDDEQCIYQWFHLECLKLKAFPKSKTWYSPDCQKRRRGRSMRTQRSE